MRHIRPAIVMIVFFTLILGVAFPLLFVAGAGAVAPNLAGGSLIRHGDTVIGSSLLGQNFTADKYLHGRPSATSETDAKGNSVSMPYDANSSGGSNLSPTSKALLDRVTGDIKASGAATVPGDMVTTSASGLDPHVSPETAHLQVARIAAARKLPVDRVQATVDANTYGRLIGLIGEPRVNVLETNIALDALTP